MLSLYFRIHPWIAASALFSIPVVLLQRRGRPTAALGWILGLALIPVPVLPLWWLIGYEHLGQKRTRRRLSSQDTANRLNALRADIPAAPPPASAVLPLVHLPEELGFGVFPSSSRNEARLLVDAGQFYGELLEAFRGARDYIHCAFFIWRADATGAEIRDLLAERARAGVTVRVLVDGFGSFPAAGRFPRDFMEPLRRAGARVETFLPIRWQPTRWNFNFRNHRKLIVVDGAAAFTGGLNVGDEYRHDWHDLGIRLRGPVIDQIQEIFVDDWYFATREDLHQARYFGSWARQLLPEPGASCSVVASGPELPFNVTLEAFFAAINAAKERVWIMTPYFIPDSATFAALRSAVFRGVDVRLLVPKKSNHWMAGYAAKSFYIDMLRAGVRIFEYLPEFLHGKAMLFDGHLAVVGSANFDIRSFRLNFEASCFVSDPGFATSLQETFERDFSNSSEVSLESLERRNVGSKIFESAIHLLSPLL